MRILLLQARHVDDTARLDERHSFAQKARLMTGLPILLVGGLRSKNVMEGVLNEGVADFVSICRPLINEPNFPNLMREGVSIKSGCLSSNNCWAKEMGVGIACKCPVEKITSSKN